MNQTYIVKAGDTLYGISNQFGVSVTDLTNLNNVNATNLQIGQVLMIPLTSESNPNNMFMYTVEKGDSLYKIAQKYKIKVQDIIDLNNLISTNLQIGQQLKIPETYTSNKEMVLPSYTNYIVKKGDSLYSIARANNIDINTLMQDNGLTSTTLSIGQNLKIRKTMSSSVEIEECFGKDYDSQETNTYTIYTVVKNDNLYSIANKYNTSIQAIIDLNNLKDSNLFIGQQLKIPTNSNNSFNKTYVVKSGDNLYSIARKFNTTVSSIKNKNNLKTNILSIGQVLII